MPKFDGTNIDIARSESVCSYCKKYLKCKAFADNIEIPLGVCRWNFLDLYGRVQFRACPTDEFEEGLAEVTA